MEAVELNPGRVETKRDEKDNARNLGFSTQKLKTPPLTIIHLTGQIDTPERLAPIMAVATAPETEHVAIFMESVAYINSSGCGGLIALHQHVEKRGFQAYIVAPVGRVARVMKRLGCYRLLHIRQSLGETITDVEIVLQLAK